MSPRIYFDHNATTAMRPAAIKAVTSAMTVIGNPTAQHTDGRSAGRLIAQAREAIALAMGVCDQDIVLNSGGTEGDNSAIYSAIQAGCKHLLISSMDHPATINAAETFGASYELIPAKESGQVDMDWLADRLANWNTVHGRPFVSIVAANSETGVLQDIEMATDLVHKAGGLILVDAVQALGKIPMTFLPDYLVTTGHKIGGPKGVGAMYVAPDAPYTPLLSGGGQERRRRSGTQNVAGIAGFGTACADMMDISETRYLRDRLESELSAIEPDLTIFGRTAKRLPNTSFFAVPDVSSMTMMMALDLEGISVSTGTACSSGKVGESRAVKAMGQLSKAPKGAIRISLGQDNTDAEVDRFLRAWCKIRRKDVREAAE